MILQLNFKSSHRQIYFMNSLPILFPVCRKEHINLTKLTIYFFKYRSFPSLFCIYLLDNIDINRLEEILTQSSQNSDLTKLVSDALKKIHHLLKRFAKN